MIDILVQIELAGGGLNTVMMQVSEIKMAALLDQQGGLTRLKSNTSTVIIDPFFNNHRLNVNTANAVCGTAVVRLTRSYIHEGRHTYQIYLSTLPNNDEDGDFLVKAEGIPASASQNGITLDTTNSRTVCNAALGTFPSLAYSSDAETDDSTLVKFALEYDAYVFAAAHD